MIRIKNVGNNTSHCHGDVTIGAFAALLSLKLVIIHHYYKVTSSHTYSQCAMSLSYFHYKTESLGSLFTRLCISDLFYCNNSR